MTDKQKESMYEYQKIGKTFVYRRRRLTLVFVLAIVFFSIAGFNLFRNGQRLLALQEKKEEVKAEQTEVSQEKKVLKNEVQLLKDDEYVAKLARAKYFYSKEGEQVYSIPQLNSSIDDEK
ncbi:FtsB family cell division protein [Vagococcus acidifermentans]|uniref:Septum formation initiator n=1 Tax=Vagococcus acidifermentans TaxID=564710 RepID=A0A430AUJ3_9ENTE|nr:septum formation initiator family protein [Vagococcus acidifermentans]RSU11716.1 hypothetical protein CBF27_07070 [Vagococcus acidifermentans]